MLNKLIDYSLRNKIVVLAAVGLLLIFGIQQVGKLPIDAVPDITENQVQVITVSPALGAPDVERFITAPIEFATSNLSGLKKSRSISRFGLSVVTLVFEEDANVYWARQQVAEKLTQVEIPKEYGTPQLAPVTTGLGEIYQYVLRPAPGFEKKFSLMDLRTIQDWMVRRQLLGLSGVADVASFGGELKQFEIAVNPYQLNACGVSISEIFEALERNNQNTGGAYIEKGPNVYYIRTEGLLGSLADIEAVVIKNLSTGNPILIKDVASVNYGSAIRYGALTYNGEREVAGGIVMMLKGENSKKVIEDVKKRIDEIQKTLPKGVIIEPYLDRTKMVDNAIKTVTNNLLEGALIVIFVLIIFLANWRAGFIVASVIPLSMLFAVILMNFFGVSGNLMSLGALDFGLIVDGAVIIVEAVIHYLAVNSFLFTNPQTKKHELDNAIKNISKKMMRSALFGQLIILLVYIPVLTLSGIEGKMFRPMAQTVIFALTGAVILSITYVPVMCAILLKVNNHSSPNRIDYFMTRLEKYYVHILKWVLNKGKWVVLSLVGLFILAIYVLINLGGEFIPELPEGDFAVETRLMVGSNLSLSVNTCLKAQEILIKNFPNEIEKVVGKTGSSEIPTDPMPLESSDLMVILKPRSEWKLTKNYNRLAELMKQKLSDIPGVLFSFQYPVAMRFNELMTGARQDVVCKIFGDDLDTLALYAQRLGKIFQMVDGTKDIYVEPLSGIPQVVVRYDRNKIAEFGLDLRTVNQTINASFAGQLAGNVFEGQRKYELVVRMQDSMRNSLENLENVLIKTNSGNYIPLKYLAEIKIVNGVNQIQRENTQRRIIVGFNVSGRDIQSVVNEIKSKLEKNINLPEGYRVVFGGSFENLLEAKARLAIAVPVVLTLIFLVLFMVFNSVKNALIIYSAIPLSTIGGVLGLFLRSMPFSISAGVGFIALFGVAVLNGLVLISEFENLGKSGIKNVYKIIFKACVLRLRPVLMTALVASLGFLPMALSTGEGAEVQKPLATVVIFGLLVATFLTLFVLPLLYAYFKNKNFRS